MSSQPVILLGIGHAPASIIAPLHVARFIKTIALVPAQAMILLGIGHAPASVVTMLHVTRFIQRLGLVSAQAMIVLRDRSPGRARRSPAPCDGTYIVGPSHAPAGDGHVPDPSRGRLAPNDLPQISR